eukprot:scaffold10070_cov115-Skeletonema_marinoi.AAC.1
MWSSLSSYLYNEDAKDVAAPSPPAAAAAPRPPTKNNTPVSLRTPSPRSSPLTIALSGGSNKGSAGKLNRASFDKSDNVSILRGVIVGTKGTGKTSLIRRLRGEDPFQKQSKSGQQRSSVEKRKLMALVPWNVPTDTEKNNNLTIQQEERVQLYVSESVGFLQSQEEQSFRKEWSTALQSQRGKEWNFAVWMIDPGMKDMMQYLQSGLDILFPTHAAGSDKAKKQPLIQHLCILLNFRDMQQDGKSSTLSQSRRMIETVRKNIEKGDGNTAGESIKLPIIVVCESSMRDCYGLQQLHSFITLPYLAQKEDQLLRRAKLAHKQQIQLTKALMESEVVDYNDFVASDNHVVMEEKPDTPKQTTPKETIERRKLEEEKERLKKQLKQQQQELDTRMHRRKSPVILGNQIISNEAPKESHIEAIQNSAGHNRKLFQTPSKPVAAKAVVPKKEVGETSLESFFSEDESEDEVEAPRRVDKRSKSNVTRLKESSSRVQVLDSDDSSNDSDDSDDDFYIDNFGTRSSSYFPKKSFPKIEPTVSVDSSEGSKSNIEDKGGDANDESVSNENNENNVGVSKIDSDEEDKEAVNSGIDIEHEGGNSNAEDNKGRINVEEASSKSNEEDESEKAIASTETMNFDAGPVDDHSVAEEEDEVDASNAEDKEEEDTGETSNTGDDEIKASGEDLGDVTEAPAKETNVEDDAATDKDDETAEANNNAEIDSCNTDSPVMKNDDVMEEDKTAATPREQQIVDGEDEPEEDDTDTVSAPTTQQILDDDDASEEENTAAVTTPQDDGDGDDEPEEENRDSTCPAQQTSNEDEEAKEDSTASAPPKHQTLDEDEVSEDENIATSTASTPPKRQALNDDSGGDESEDEFIFPASEEQQVYDSDYESSKVSGDAGDTMREANIDVQQDTVPTQRDADVAETKTNGDNNTTTVSSAALAAIEQARLEAEQMMALSQPQPPKPKKEKKKKKEKAKAKKEKKKKSKKEDSSSNSF